MRTGCLWIVVTLVFLMMMGLFGFLSILYLLIALFVLVM